jgi:hypothetical protein
MACASARRMAAVLTVGVAVMMAAGSATAATVTPFGCRASTVRVTLLNSITTEPTIANPKTTPCATDTAGSSTVSVPTTGSAPVIAGPVGAFTYSAFSTTGATAPGATAVAAVQGVTIPTTGGGQIVIVGPVRATASYACVNDQLVAQGSSTLNLIYINGTATPVPAGSPTTIQLGGGSFIAVNQKITTGNSLTERVLEVKLAGIADIVVGEAQVTQSTANPCAGTSGPPPVLGICPPGSTLDIAGQECVIIVNNPGGVPTVIVVSRPFQGPSGGTVFPTSVVAKKYPGFPCTTGPGPKYALVATKVGARVIGTLKSDRILALGARERVAGLGGNDCLNGNASHQKLFDGNGKDKIYGGPGSNRIAVGNGNDYINGRKGNGDFITAGNGNDRVFGGLGNNTIAVGLGRDYVYGGRGRQHIFAGANSAQVSCGTGGHNIAFLRSPAARYAKQHGCQKVVPLR